jgi:hypothetical protein
LLLLFPNALFVYQFIMDIFFGRAALLLIDLGIFLLMQVALDQKTYELIGTDYPGNMTLKDSGSK